MVLLSEMTIDVIIVGAGVAGAALAYTLGKDERQVHLIERDLSLQDRISGEVLQPGGYSNLIQLGLEDCVEEIDAQLLDGYTMHKNEKSFRMPYPLLNSFSGDAPGRSFHNGPFVQRLRERAASLPNVKVEQGTVTSLIEEQEIIRGVNYKTKDGQQLTSYAPLTIVCDGCFSNLRRSLCTAKVEVPSHFVGLVLENVQLPEYPNSAHFIFANPSPILFYRLSSNEIRCLVDIPGQALPSISDGEMAHHLKTVAAPQVPDELYDAFIDAVDKGNIKSMPNRCMPASPYPTPGAILFGDALNMRHALTGGGMSVAMHDIVILRDLLRPLQNLNPSPALWKYLATFYTLRKPMATTIGTLSAVMYKVLSASPDRGSKEMSQACFHYFGLGGFCTSGIVALCSGLEPRPLILMLHLFLILVYGVICSLHPFPSPKRLWTAVGMIMYTCRIASPILKEERIGWTLSPATTNPAHYKS